MPISRSARAITPTASPSAASGARLKLSVTARNCSWWATTSGAVVCSKRAIAPSGTIGLPEIEAMIGAAFEVNELDCASAAMPEAGT